MPRFEPAGELPERLQQALSVSPQLASVPVSDLAPRRMRRREGATVYHLTSRADPRAPSYWLKVHTAGTDRARLEFELLKAMRARIRTKGVTVVDAVALLEDENAMITRHADGRPLSLLLPTAFAPSLLTRDGVRRVERLCRRAGRWLAYAHRLDDEPRAPLPVDGILRDVQSVLHRPATRWRLPHDLVSQIERASAELAASVRPEDLHPVRAHGDFGTHNILLAGEDLVVLDPCFTVGGADVSPYRPRCVDLTRFWSTIQGNTSANLRSRRRAAVVEAFLDGYAEISRVSVTPSQPIFRLFALRQLILSLRDWPSPVARVIPAIRTRALRRWLGSL